MSQKLFVSCYTVTNLAGCKTRKWSCGWQRRDNLRKMPTACGVDERQDTAITKYQETHYVGKGCVQVLQAFEQLKSKLPFFPVVFSEHKQVPSAKTTSRYIRYMLRLAWNERQTFRLQWSSVCILCEFQREKVFPARKCRKRCYQWDVTAQNKSRSSEVIMRPRFKITHLCFCHVSQTYWWNSFHVYVIQVRLHHLPHNPKDKELNTALGHVWTIRSKWICILITLDIVRWTKQMTSRRFVDPPVN